MTEDGELQCTLCKEWKYIGEFYTLKVYEGLTPFKEVWYGDPVTGKQFGRPNSYCKKCNLISQKGSEAVAKKRAEVAERLGLEEAAREPWVPHMATKAELEAEAARIERLYGGPED
jgi:hypothetical protein